MRDLWGSEIEVRNYKSKENICGESGSVDAWEVGKAKVKLA